ncbi:pentapeptide repeat-containing protein (plasmid) [Phormidium sp. CLA17]|nr:pentapeptide repeat-containing protein [Leptolyngbya sp. Cla-17]
MRGADLHCTNLMGADLQGANLIGVDFTNANLQTAKMIVKVT